MLPYLSETRGTSAIPIWCVTKRSFAAWRKKQPQAVQRWLKATGFEPTPGGHAVVPAGGRAKRAIAGVVLGVSDNGSPWDYAGLPVALRRGTYRIETDIIENLKRIYYFAKRISKALVEIDMAFKDED